MELIREVGVGSQWSVGSGGAGGTSSRARRGGATRAGQRIRGEREEGRGGARFGNT